MTRRAAFGKKIAIGASALMIGMGSAACGGGAKASTDDIVIGHLAHLTGPTAGPYGLPFDKGIKLGVEAVNESGVLGDLTLKLDSQDVGGEVSAAITQYNKFLRSGTSIFVSPSSTPIQRALQPYAEKDDAVLLSSSVGDETKKEPGNVFALPDAITPNQMFGEHVAVEDKRKKAVMVVDGDNPAFKDIAVALQQGFEKGGGTFVDRIDISAKDNDFSPVVTKIKSMSPDAVFFSTLSETAGNLLIQMDRTGGFEDVQMAGGVSWGKQVFDVAGDVAEGAQFAAYWAPTDGGEFEKRFNEEYEGAPESVAATGYETAWLIAGAASLAVENDEQINGASIAKHMPKAAETEIVKENGPYESWDFRASGTAIYPGVVMEFGPSGVIAPVAK